jgi:hypothetical protein
VGIDRLSEIGIADANIGSEASGDAVIVLNPCLGLSGPQIRRDVRGGLGESGYVTQKKIGKGLIEAVGTRAGITDVRKGEDAFLIGGIFLLVVAVIADTEANGVRPVNPGEVIVAVEAALYSL